MSGPYIIIIATLALALGAVLTALFMRNRSASNTNDQLMPFKLIQDQMGDIRRTLDTRLGESSEVLRMQMGQSNEMIHRLTKDMLQNLGTVKEELVRVGEGNKQVLSISEQLKHLQDILKNPKNRGTLGEYHLETALLNILPPGAYQMQYPFKDGTKVDAVIFYSEKIIPIDSKFSLENYTRFLGAENDEEKARYAQALSNDLKVRIDETSKYIKPAEDTMDFAFMFIPSEALYYDLLINKIGTTTSRNLVEYAVGEKRVHIVSPTTIYAYLQTILQGLRQAEINRGAEQIKKNIGELSKHLESYEKFMQKLGTHLQTSANMYTSAYKEFKKIDKDIFKITGDSIGVEPLAVLTSHTEDDEEESKTVKAV
jgi:DNA recombination protein RmuC